MRATPVLFCFLPKSAHQSTCWTLTFCMPFFVKILRLSLETQLCREPNDIRMVVMVVKEGT